MFISIQVNERSQNTTIPVPVRVDAPVGIAAWHAGRNSSAVKDLRIEALFRSPPYSAVTRI